MSPLAGAWIETSGVVALAVLGAAVGWKCARFRQPWWLAGYITPLLIVTMISASRWFPWLEPCWPFRLVMAGRNEFALLAPVCSMLLTTPLSRLRQRREKFVVAGFLVVCVVSQSVLAFLMPAFSYRRLLDIQTLIDVDGVCIQSNSYTCGPAAAVTALRQKGFRAEEGELAVWAPPPGSPGLSRTCCAV